MTSIGRLAFTLLLIELIVAAAIVACAHARHRPDRRAVASWYGPGLYGNSMACGGRLYLGTIGVAHKYLPCGTKLRTRYLNSRYVRTRVVDRGPYVGGRTFDLTAGLRYTIGFPNGVAVVRWRLGWGR